MGRLPGSVRTAVQRLLAEGGSCGLSASDLLHQPSPEPLLAFPSYFPQLYELLGRLRTLPPAARPALLRARLDELAGHGEEALLMLLPSFGEMLALPECLLGAVELIDKLVFFLGRHYSVTLLLPMLRKILEVKRFPLVHLPFSS